MSELYISTGTSCKNYFSGGGCFNYLIFNDFFVICLFEACFQEKTGPYAAKQDGIFMKKSPGCCRNRDKDISFSEMAFHCHAAPVPAESESPTFRKGKTGVGKSCGKEQAFSQEMSFTS